MNLDKLFAWVSAVVLGVALAGKLGSFQQWIWKAQAQVLYESRTSTWGSPNFFTEIKPGQNRKLYSKNPKKMPPP